MNASTTIPETLAAATLRIALTQVGVQEQPKGSNSGEKVNMYLASVGLKPGYSWCMAFVYWCASQAALQLDIKNPLIKTGGVLRQWNENTLRKLVNRSSSVSPGDIFIMDTGKGTGHTGLVKSISRGLIETVEGNTNDDGSREGYEVCIRHRSITTIKGFIQLH
ncbi:CHAP domain-containing protein [Chitinophaga sp. YR573]|uniref:CHAP domain-containing protein n=1 Tax=Chitinophaga sp. YR573 TaxID=1881040 RepID=UPI0008C28703|nr:CHAP domain-containing protein [Chitinophaga sp. YR573]SEW01968.1 CHAP domain-containing protein [Chitinophaga sp. YR573]